MLRYKVLDLFSGAGGMSEGFLQAGFQVPFANEYTKEASLTYQNRHKQLGYPLTFYEGDVRDLTKRKKLFDFLNGEEVDVIVGGPPCQGFSLTGKRSKEDERNNMFLEYLKIVKLVKPKYFVLENVEGILSYRFGRIKGISGIVYEDQSVPQIIYAEALKLGYLVKWRLLNAKDYGVPQNRPRVIFIGHKISLKRNQIISCVTEPDFPIQQNKIVTVQEAISDLRFLRSGEIATKYDKRYKITEYQRMLRNGLTPDINREPCRTEFLKNHQTSRHGEITTERFKLLSPGESIDGLLNRLDIDQNQKLFTKKYRCTKLSPNAVAPTILTLPDDIIHFDPKNPRILTVRELARLQSFDDSFEFLGKRTTGGERRKYETPQYTQVGNAVPPLLARAVAEKIMEALINPLK
ncbi:hypothetical protein B9C88_17185 [Brevibacillus laterosporus]|nr:hypothetical protein B9C88_17185 [Brevibacillus laterosporus]